MNTSDHFLIGIASLRAALSKVDIPHGSVSITIQFANDTQRRAFDKALNNHFSHRSMGGEIVGIRYNLILEPSVEIA